MIRLAAVVWQLLHTLGDGPSESCADRFVEAPSSLPKSTLHEVYGASIPGAVIMVLAVGNFGLFGRVTDYLRLPCSYIR